MVAGVRYNDLAGQTLSEKLRRIATEEGMTAFMQKATTSKNGEGFFLVHGEVGSLAIIPSGYVIVNAGMVETGGAANDEKTEVGSSGLRWGYLDASNAPMLKQTKEMSEEMLKAFPELSVSPYKAWGETLETFLMPVISWVDRATDDACIVGRSILLGRALVVGRRRGDTRRCLYVFVLM